MEIAHGRSLRVGLFVAWASFGIGGCVDAASEAGNPSVTIRGALTATFIAAADTTIIEGEGNQGSAADCNVRSDAGNLAGMACLMKWDLSSIPPGSTVLDAALWVRVVNSSEQVFDIHPLLPIWSETGATWAFRAIKSFWQVAGARGPSDRGPLLAQIQVGSTGSWPITMGNAEQRALIQRWIDNPKTNRGLIFASPPAPASTDGLGIASSEREATDPGYGPRLTIQYRDCTGAPPTDAGGC